MEAANGTWNRIRGRLSCIDLVITRHARDRMLERRISEIDIRSCMKTGMIVEILDDNDGRTKWRIESERGEGCRVVVIGEPDEKTMCLIVVSCWR